LPILLFAAGLLLWTAPAVAQDSASRTDGTIVNQEPCRFSPYDQTSAFTKRYYPRLEYETTVASTTVDCLRIHYLSDGLNVVGFIVKPHNSGSRRYPVIVYNRGGFRDIGKT
jgi:hypothetical protein